MLGICSVSHEPFFNLATEDYLLHKRNEDFLMLYINDPCVIIGKHQIVYREVNIRYVEEKKIPIIRRISGGGTVFHDRGNLNFSFIKQSKSGKQINFKLYTKPIIDFLFSLGLNPVFESKNDITIDGLKISGNAEHVFRERVLHHGTLLFDTSDEDLRQSLKAKSDIYFTHAVESNRTSVMNLKGRIKNINNADEFSKAVLTYFLNNMPDLQIYNIPEEEQAVIRSLVDSKYKTWEWNYGYGPAYTIINWFVVTGKSYRFRLLIKDGIIWESEIDAEDELKAAGKKLIGCRHMFKDLFEIFRSENIQISQEEIYKFF